MVDANELARKTLQEARERRLLETAERNDNPPPPISRYVGFDCKTGESLVQPLGGGIVRAEPIYNTATRPGDVMDLHVSQGLPKADNRSAWVPEPEPVVVEEAEVFGKIKILFADPDKVLWIGGDRAIPTRLGQGWDSVRSFPASSYNLVNLGDGDRYLVSESRNGLNRPSENGNYILKRWGRQRDLVIEDVRIASVEDLLRTEQIIGNGAILTSPFEFLGLDGGSNFFPNTVPGMLSSSSFGDAFTGTVNAFDGTTGSSSMSGGSTPFYFGITGAYVGSQSLNGSTSFQLIPASPSGGEYFENSETIVSLNNSIALGRITVDETYQYNRSAFNSGINSPLPRENEATTTIELTRTETVFGNTSDSAMLYFRREYSADLVGSQGPVVSSVKSWLHQSSGITEVKAPEYRRHVDNIGIGSPTGEMTMIGTVFYEARYEGYDRTAESEMTVYVHELRDGEYVETRNFKETVYPIPETATILRWSYHP